jgi:hypothetical protein
MPTSLTAYTDHPAYGTRNNARCWRFFRTGTHQERQQWSDLGPFAKPSANDGVDGAPNGISVLRWSLSSTHLKGEAMGRAAGVWHHRRWMKVMEVPHAPS